MASIRKRGDWRNVKQEFSPDLLYDEWEWSKKLNTARGERMNGPLTVSFNEIAMFFALQGIRPQVWQADLLQTLDQVAIGRLVVGLSD